MQAAIQKTTKALFLLSFLVMQIHCAKPQQALKQPQSPQIAKPAPLQNQANKTAPPIATGSMSRVTIPIPEQQKSLIVENGALTSIVTFKDGQPQEHKWEQPIKTFVVANSSFFVLYGDDHTLYVYDTASEKLQKQMMTPLQAPFDLAELSDKGDYLAVADSNKNLRLYYLPSTTVITIPSIPTGATVVSFQFSKDRKNLAIVYRSLSWNGITEASHSMVLYPIVVVSLNKETVSPLNEFNVASYILPKDKAPCIFVGQSYVLKCPVNHVQYLSVINNCGQVCSTLFVKDSKFPPVVTGAFLNTDEKELLVIGQDKPTKSSLPSGYTGLIYSFDSKNRELTNPKAIAILDTTSIADFPLIQWSPKGDSLIASIGDNVYQIRPGKTGTLFKLGNGLSKAGFALAAPHGIYGISKDASTPPIKKSKTTPSPWKAISQTKKGPSIWAFLPKLRPDLATIFTDAQKIVYVSPKQQYVLAHSGSLFSVNSSTPELLFAEALTFALSDDQKRLFIVGKNNIMKVQEVGTTPKKEPKKPLKKQPRKKPSYA